MLESVTLTPLTGTILFCMMVICGRNFRQAWKAQGPRWQVKAWAYGILAGLSLLILAFIPLSH